MGCGISSGRDDSNYHGVAAPYGAMLGQSSSSASSASSTSETSSEASDDFFEDNENQQEPTRRSKKSGKGKKKRKKRNDAQMFNFGEFRVKMVDELGKEDALTNNQAPRQNQPPAPRVAVIKRYAVGTCGGHASRIKMTLVTPLEKNLFTCSNEDATVSMWDINQGIEVGRLVGHDDAVIGGCVSSDSRLIATTSRDATLIIWDISTQKIFLSLTHPKVVVCCCFSPDTQLVVSGCQDQVCRVWDLRTSKEILNFAEHRGIVMSIGYAPNSGFIASGGSDKKVYLWNLMSPKSILAFHGHVGAVVSLDINNSSTQVVSADEKLVIVWKSDSGSKLHVFDSTQISSSPLKRGFWNCVSFGPGNFNELVVIGCSNRMLYFFHEEGREELSLYLRAAVCSLGHGTEQFIAAGDAFGNNYVVTLA